MSTATKKRLQKRLLNNELRLAGNKLLQPPNSLELLPLLDHAENLLSRVDQEPTKGTKEAMSPLTRALVVDALIRHYNVDVKVAVASCLSEVIRITAPDCPYDDDQMKVVFQLIVSSLEGLSVMYGRSYYKRVSILTTMSDVKSCVIMLDLECDALIVEMFRLFLANIRDYHSEIVISSMVRIMVLVIEENNNTISSEILLTPLLTCLKKGNKEIRPIAVKLAEKVFEKCNKMLLLGTLVRMFVDLTIQCLPMNCKCRQHCSFSVHGVKASWQHAFYSQVVVFSDAGVQKLV